MKKIITSTVLSFIVAMALAIPAKRNCITVTQSDGTTLKVCLTGDEHMHFYCEHCHSMICLHDMPLPCVELPSDFELHSVNFIIRGICPECRKKRG